MMQEFDCISEQIIIKIFIDMKHEVETDLFGIQSFLQGEFNFFYISVDMIGLNHQSRIIGGNEVVNMVAFSFPELLSYDFFSLVVDKVNWGELNGIIFMFVSIENTYLSKIEDVNHLIIPAIILIIEEIELSLPHSILSNIINIVVIDNSRFLLMICSLRTCLSIQHKSSLFHLPNTSQSQVEIVNTIGLSTSILEFKDIETFVLSSLTEIDVGKLYLSFLFGLEPDNHRMCITLLDWAFIGPLSFSRFIIMDGLAIFWIMSIIVVVVGNKEVMNVVSSLFNDCKEFGILKGLYPHLNNILEMVLMIDGAHFFLFKIDDVNS